MESFSRNLAHNNHMKTKAGLFIKNKRYIALIKQCYKEIASQALPGSGIHLRVEIQPKGEILVVGDIERFGKRFAGAESIVNDTTIGSSVNRITKRALNILKATKKDLIRCKIL